MKKFEKQDITATGMISIPRTEYEALMSLREQNAELSRNLDYMMQQLRLAKKKVFGPSSEQTCEEVMDQLRFVFNEAEAWLPKEQEAQPPEETPVAAHTRKKRSSKLEEVIPENVPVEVVEHHVPERARICPECGTLMESIGKEVRRTLVLIPAQVKVREDVYYTYACQTCKTEGPETPIRKAAKMPQVIPGSFASPEAISHIMVQKFVMGAPLYRQEQEWNRSGVRLSRQTMSNWILRAADDWLRPLYAQFRQRLIQREVLHADETTLQVLREPGKSAQSKSYMWLYRTSGDAEHPIVLYEYRPDRKAQNAEAFLDGFSGYLHADGYSGYHRLPGNIRVVGCWAHARRKFDEAVNALPKEQRSGCSALEGLAFCNKLFSIEKELATLTVEERYEQRQNRAKPVLDALLAWANTKKAPPKSALGKALHYLLEQWPYLTRYLEDGRLEVSNNRAERSIKPFVISRKNFLFANTPRGAQGSAVIYSLIETAKENGLDPFRYLTYIFSSAPLLSAKEPDWAKRFLPECVPDFCKAREETRPDP